MPLDIKYRPGVFGEVIGQDVAVTILRASILKNKFNSAYLFSGPSGVGKAQPLWSDVLTPTGFKKMGELKIGDEIIGKNGKTYNISNMFDHKNRDYYKIIFDDRSWAECDEDHLWLVRQYKKGCNNNYFQLSMRVIPLKEIKTKIQENYKIGIPLNQPVKFKSKEKLKIPPYLMGALLGDGSFKSGAPIGFTNTEKDIINKIKILLPKDCKLNFRDKITYSIIKNKHNPADNINKKNNTTSLDKHIKQYELYNKYSWEKHIPETYMFSSINNRLELLRGLFDTDGHVHTKTVIEYSTTSAQLASQVMFIVRSLGGKSFMYSRMGSYKKNNKIKKTRINYRIYSSMPDNLCPISSKKKIKKYGGHRQKQNKFIKQIVYQGKTDTRCLLVTSPDHLYITNDFNVTHNTTIGRIFAKAILCEKSVNGDPCGTCESCRLFQEEKHFGYRELDAASYGGKEDMIKLRDDASFLSVEKKKIILLDECHDISKQGQDALLKQVEQCPEHLIYIFCTTEPEKVKPTLRQRCIQFQFPRIDSSLILTRLKEICVKENITYDEDALHMIADRSNGHVRDALKCLEESTYFGPITLEAVSKISPDYSLYVFDIISGLGHDLKKSLDVCKKAVNFITVRELYEQILEMTSDTIKLICGYDDFLPNRKELLTRLRDIHGYSMLEFLNYLITRDRHVDRIGLQSDIILLHYKFCSGSFKIQVSDTVAVAQESVTIPVETPMSLTDQNTSSISFAQLTKMSIKDRAKILRGQKTSQNSSEEEDQPKIPNEWSLPKEKRLGDDSFNVEKELSPLEFSKLMVGGRGSEPVQ